MYLDFCRTPRPSLYLQFMLIFKPRSAGFMNFPSFIFTLQQEYYCEPQDIPYHVRRACHISVVTSPYRERSAQKQDAPQLSRQLHNPPEIHKTAPTYSHVAIVPISNVARLITIAGQVGIDPKGNIAPDLAGQVELALENLGKCLASARCGKEEIVKVTLYIVAQSRNKADDIVRRSLYTRFWGELQPPRYTLVYVVALAYRNCCSRLRLWRLERYRYHQRFIEAAR